MCVTNARVIKEIPLIIEKIQGQLDKILNLNDKIKTLKQNAMATQTELHRQHDKLQTAEKALSQKIQNFTEAQKETDIKLKEVIHL